MRLKDHVHGVSHLDDLTVHQAQSLVVVQDGVHVFDPVSVNGPIENDPPSLLIGLLIGAEAEYAPKDAISELLRNRIVVAIQLR